MLGLITIGQSPREDVVQSMFGQANFRSLLQAGALDGLSRAEITALAPQQGEHPLVTRLSGGAEVVVAKERVAPLMNDAIDRLQSAGALTMCVLCTGEFTELQSERRIVYPDRILLGVVNALQPEGKLGVVMPHEGQREGMTIKWGRASRPVLTSVVSPYQGSGSFDRAAADLESAGCEMIVLDCMGYSAAMQSQAQSAVQVPVLLANLVVGSVLSTMIPGLAGLTQDALRV